MSRFASYLCIGAVIFAMGILFTIGLGNYLERMDSTAPAVLQSSSCGYLV